jgi:xanthine dehydrogenase large subunit
VPPRFAVNIIPNNPAKAATIFKSKGIGEPPFLLATAIWTALKDAIGSVGGHQIPVDLDLPATPERVLRAVRIQQGRTLSAA